jgi:hypothetical protein
MRLPEFVSVTCPACGETFEVEVPQDADFPAELDYDCEVCCRPMVIRLWVTRNGVETEAHRISE